MEKDPNGKPANTAGAKLDAGKVRPSLVLRGFASALIEVSKVGTFGAGKYTDNGWVEVPDGVKRYDEAKLRHYLAEAAGEMVDEQTGLLHAAHEAWNALARLDLMLREQEKAVDLGEVSDSVYLATGCESEGLYHLGATGKLTKCTK